jgi:hypothetical protein
MLDPGCGGHSEGIGFVAAEGTRQIKRVPEKCPIFDWAGRVGAEILERCQRAGFRHIGLAQFCDDFFSAWGDPPSSGGGYVEWRLVACVLEGDENSLGV